MTTGVTTESASEKGLVRYRIVPEKSTFIVRSFAEGLFSAFGHNPIIAIRDFSGEAQFVPDTFETASLTLNINARALTLTGEVKEKDRAEIERTMREQVLEVETYPEILFSSANISASRLAEGRYRVRIIGDLTLHGVTQKNIWISAEAKLDDSLLRTQGEFSLKQTDYGIRPFSVVGGAIKLKNELRFTFDIAAERE